MKVFKFGGASVKSAEAVMNVGAIIKNFEGEQLVVVVSAMGKSTNALEEILALHHDKGNYFPKIEAFVAYHEAIIDGLFPDNNPELKHKVKGIAQKIINYFNDDLILESEEKLYSHVVAIGEIISTTILSDYLNALDIANVWLDAREYIRTDGSFKEGIVNWEVTTGRMKKGMPLALAKGVVITQGFIGGDAIGNTTTLGREGSDFTGAVFAHCLNAESLTIWKDVPGILNADPKIIEDTVLFKELPYQEASEMTYYGAKVIHPRTIKPLALKNIPLYVRCFDTPHEAGTVIHDCQPDELAPSIIFKHNQCLIAFEVIDLTFINEENLSIIFSTLASLQIKINMMQNSAISFSVCVDYDKNKVKVLVDKLKADFKIIYYTDLQLVTVKNYTEAAIDSYKTMPNKLLEQVSRDNYRVLISENVASEWHY